MSSDQYRMAISGEAPNGESFEVSLRFNNEDALDHRIDSLTKAAHEVMRGIVDPADKPSVQIQWTPTDELLAAFFDGARQYAKTEARKTGV